MATVWLSYNHHDLDLARRVKLRLEAKAHTIYIDDEVATAGVAWRDKLQGALRKCDGVVVLLTENAINSPYVGTEVGLARVGSREEDKFLIPVSVGVGIPGFVSDLHLTTMEDTSDPALDDAVDRIGKGITTHMTEVAKTYPRVFVSHRHKDRDVTKALASLIEAAFKIDPSDIRCTSVHPYALPLGERTSDRLRTEVSKAEVVLGVIGPDIVESSYVLFELGAAWGHNILTFPLLVGGASYENVPSPLNELHSASLESRAIAQQLVENLEFSTSLESRSGAASRVAEEVRKLAKAARSTGKSAQASPKKRSKRKK